MDSTTNHDHYENYSLHLPVTGAMNLTFANSHTNETDSDVDLKIPHYMLVSVTLSYLVIFLLGVGGNIMVVWIVVRNRDMRSATNVFLLSLSIADLLVLVICMPSALVEFYGKDVWYLGQTMCSLVPFLENSSAYASALIIMAISVERYYAICRPLKVKIVCTFTGTAKVVSTMWVLAAAAAVPFSVITYTEEATFYDSSKVQVCRTHIHLHWHRSYVILTVVTFYVVPLIVLLTLYTLICRKLVKQSVDPKISHNPRTSMSLKLRRQVVIMLCVITSLFFLCLLPFKVVSLWTIHAPQQIEKLGFEGYLNLLNFSRVMYYINSAINPVVYNLISTRFRNYFKYSITCGRVEPPAVLSRVSTWNHSRASSKRSTSTSTYVETMEPLGCDHVTQHNNHSNCTVNISLISVPEKEEFK